MFPHLSEANLKEGVFVGPDIRKLIFDEDSLLTMTKVAREAWIAFKSVVAKFLGDNKDPDYVTIVANILEKFKVPNELKNSFIEFALGIVSRKYWCSE
jgi:DNA transposition AAA+ family ATPase